MPEMIPVANTIQAPNVGQTLSNLSGLIGIQQQKQTLQTGAYQQQTAQAGAQQSQQKNQELQALSTFTQNASKDPAYQNADGSLNVQKFQQDASKVAPTYGQEYIGQMTTNANESIQNREALTKLTAEQRQMAGSYMNAFAISGGGPKEWLDTTQQMQNLSDDPGYQRYVQSMLLHTPQVGNMPDAQAAQTLQQFARRAAAGSGLDVSASAPAAQSYYDKKGNLAFYQSNPQAPGGIQPMGPQMAAGVTPAERLPQQTTNAAQNILNRDPLTGALSAPAQASPNLNPSAAEAQTQQGLAAGITQRVSQAQTAANNTIQAQDALTRAQSILRQPGAVTTGAAFEQLKGLKNLLASAGVDTAGATDANSLVKNLARYEAARATGAGLGGTDAARELSHNGNPNTQIDNNALSGIVDQSLATEKAIAAYASKQSKAGTDPNALIKNENDFRNIPNLIEGYQYALSRSPAEATAFLTQHGLTASQMKATRAKIKQFEDQ